MKKIIILTIAVVCSMLDVLSAEFDIIIKTNSETIEAVIQEVSASEVRYKRPTNINGPVFVIATQEIASILFANGEAMVMNQNATTDVNNTTNSSELPLLPQQGKLQTLSISSFMLDDKIMNTWQLRRFLAKDCPLASKYFNKWDNMEKTGWSFFTLGPIMMLPLGLTLYLYQYDDPMWISGVFFMSLGGAMTLTSIPLIACGAANKKRVCDVYNTNCWERERQTTTSLRLNINASANGIGLALAF